MAYILVAEIQEPDENSTLRIPRTQTSHLQVQEHHILSLTPLRSLNFAKRNCTLWSSQSAFT